MPVYQETKALKGITVHKVAHMAVQQIHEKDVVYQNVPNVSEIYLTRCFQREKKSIMMCVIGPGLSRLDDMLTLTIASGADLST